MLQRGVISSVTAGGTAPNVTGKFAATNISS
jgi:hypothetical protein